ncbi:MAG: C40 family peptidase [Spirochaetales bacterium]|nr:C40 family peptidase [Spirochaetales bacterium]
MHSFSFILFIVLCFCPFLDATTINFEQTGVKVVQKKIVKEAKTYLGSPYVWGDTGSKGFDCSGLVFRVFSDLINTPLPRQVESLKLAGHKITEGLTLADLVFFDTSGGGKATHVGIYIGENKFIHAASAGKKRGVIISSLTENYYKKRYLGARRFITRGFPLIKVDIDDGKYITSAYPEELSPGMPVYISVTSSFKKTTSIEIFGIRNKKEKIYKRMQLSQKSKPTVLWFIPDNEKWSIMIRKNNKEKCALITL